MIDLSRWFQQMVDGTYEERNALEMGTGAGASAEEKGGGDIPEEERRRGGSKSIGIKWSSSPISTVNMVLLA